MYLLVLSGHGHDILLIISLHLPARNAVVVLVASLVGYSLKAQGAWFHGQITLVDYQTSSFPGVRPPDLTLENATSPVTLFKVCD